MGVLDGLGDHIADNQDKIDGAIGKGGDFVDSKTDNKYVEHVDTGQDFLRDKVGESGEGEDAPARPRKA